VSKPNSMQDPRREYRGVALRGGEGKIIAGEDSEKGKHMYRPGRPRGRVGKSW